MHLTNGNYLAIDLGAESGRVILGTFDGKRLTLTEVHRFSNGPIKILHNGETHMHWDALRLWSEIKNGISLAKKHGVINSIGVDTWGVDFGLLDRSGNLLGNPFHYRDCRTDGMLEEAFRLVSRENIFEQTGIQFMQINTLYQLLSMVINKSPVLESASTLLTMPDLFNYWLTGEKVCEFSIGTTTQCFDPRKGNWAYSLLEKMGIPTHIFPRIVSPGTIIGPMHPQIAEDLGVSGINIIAPACHDTGSAVAAVPAENDEYAWISSGTWSIMGVIAPKPIITPESLAFNFTNEGGAINLNHDAKSNTYRYSKNIMGLWLVQECRRTWAAQGNEYSYSQIANMATQAEPLLSLVNPDSNDFLKPGDMPSRIQAFCRKTHQPVPETPGAIIRCALESIVLVYRRVLEHLETSLGHKLNPIHIIGGGTQNRLLNQLTADVTNRKVITGPIEATAIGNILVQALAQGHISSVDEVRKVARQSFTPEVYLPNPSTKWDSAYKRFNNYINL